MELAVYGDSLARVKIKVQLLKILAPAFMAIAPVNMLHSQAFMASNALQHWRKALASSNRKVANAVIIGDSIACCVGPQDYGNVWTNSLRSYTNARYKQHGSGIIPVGNNDKLALNPQWSLHNNSGQVTNVNYGPYQGGINGTALSSFGGVFRLTGGAELTLLVPERLPYKLVLYYASSTDSGDGIVVRSEKKPLGILGKETSPRFQAHTAVLPLPQNISTLSFSPSSTSGSAYIYGAEFIYDDDGVSIHNLAHGYARSEAYGGDPANQLAFLEQIPGSIQLAIISLGVNDSIDGTPITTYEYRRNIQEIISHLRLINPNISIVIYDEPNDLWGENATPLPQSLVRDQEMQLAQENNVTYLSPFPTWGTYANASALGYFAIDGVHPSDLGDRNLAGLLEAVVFPDEPANWR